MESFKQALWQNLRAGKDDILLVLIIALIGFGGFGLGRLSVKEFKKEPVSILSGPKSRTVLDSEAKVSNSANLSNLSNSTNLSSVSSNSGEVVASKNGKVYHLPWCPGALKIKSENLITFKSVEEAKRAGLAPAANCKGLE